MTNSLPPADMRRAIVDAAVHLFEKQGYEATSISNIVSSIGATKGAFYHYFDTKEDLLLLIHSTFIDKELAAITEIDTEYPDPRDSLALIIEEIIASVEEYKSYMTVFFEQRRFLSEFRFREVKHKRDSFEAKVVEIIDRGVHKGLFKEVASSQVLAFGIIGMSTWSYQWYRPGRSLSAREIGRMYARTVLDGLCV